MPIKIDFKISQSILEIAERSEGCRLDESVIDSLSGLENLCQYLDADNMQAFLFANIFSLSFKEKSVSIHQLAEYFNCHPLKVADYHDDFERLLEKGILDKKSILPSFFSDVIKESFAIPDNVTEAIIKNQNLPKIHTYKNNSIYGVFETLMALSGERDLYRISSMKLFMSTRKILLENQHHPLIKSILDLRLEMESAFIFIYVLWKTMEGEDSSNLEKTLKRIYDQSSEKVRLMQAFMSEQHELIKEGLVEINKNTFSGDTSIKLSQKTIDMIERHGIKTTVRRFDKYVIRHEKIAGKKLFFNPAEQEKLDMISGVLSEKEFEKMQERLKEHQLPAGITILLHGKSGTGKTESVLQLAKTSGRDIFKVEMSEYRSAFFGESEKNVKKIFNDYQSFADRCKRKPILLFNEADALISKRHAYSAGTVSNVENSIQNVLLEELENFNGIFLATTNMISNFDSAFARRFLFKIEFQPPALTVKEKIWQSKIGHLSKTESKQIARKYSLTGGQIDNVSKKCSIYEVLNNRKAPSRQIEAFCTEESSGYTHGQNLGFKK